MKVLLVNGGPHEEGCTHTALAEAAKALNEAGIATEEVWLGNKPIAGCIGCQACRETELCFRDDIVNEFIAKTDDADGFIFGSPVHFASATGALTSFMDRVFYARMRRFWGKPAASVVCCRRGGATATFDQINKYFTISNMPIVSSQYWNMVHGHNAEQAKEDLEGIQTMRVLGKNMAWLLKSIEAGKQAGIKPPEPETRIYTNFIR